MKTLTLSKKPSDASDGLAFARLDIAKGWPVQFDDAFDIIAEHAARFENALLSAPNEHQRQRLREAAYDCDLWIASIVNLELGKGAPLTDDKIAPFYEAAWEMCRLGVLRPGPYAPKGMGSGGGSHTDGYSITAFGRTWLHDPERKSFGDAGRMAKLLGSFDSLYGSGFAQRSIEAIRCHRAGNYLACCAMAGAAAESILLAIAIAKTQDEPRVVSEYLKGGGRSKVTAMVTTGLAAGLQKQFEAGLDLLKYWRDNASHGKAVAISEVEAFASLGQLLRLAQLSADRWSDLTK